MSTDTADIVVSEFMSESAVDSARGDYKVLYRPDLVDDRAALLDALREARALIVRNRTQVDEQLLEAGPQLQVVGRLGVGLDNIDQAACNSRGVVVCPASGANDSAVAEWVIGTALLLLRGAYTSLDAMLAGRWPRGQLMGHEIGGKTLGLVGFGGIARKTAAFADALAMRVVAFDPYVPTGDERWGACQRVGELDELLARADVISLHVPLTDSTRHLIGADAIAKMKSGAYIVNAARGGVIDEAALVEALRSGHLGGAALDVFEHEPLSQADAQKFDNLPNLILTPHIAGVTHESNTRVSDLTMKNVRRILEGKS